MTNYDFLRDHAMKNVWCSPEQDTQYVFKLAKISPYGGVRKSAKVLWRTELLPDDISTWNVYQIGQVHPLILGLFPEVYEWVSFSRTCNEQKMVVDIYTEGGVQLPRFQTYYKYNKDKNLIVATRKNSKIPMSFDKDDVYVRVYTNEYFNTLHANHNTDIIHTQGMVPMTNANILNLQGIFETYQTKPGITYAFVNGLKVDHIDVVNVKLGDSVEFLYDSTIYKVVDFKVDDLMDFTSTLDQMRKYLLHYGGVGTKTIDYQDDIDVFVLQATGSKHKGLYYHKNDKRALRNITHRDYSVVVPYVLNYARKLSEIAQTAFTGNEVYLRLHIRKSGYVRSLVYENNRIHELYKLSDEDIVKALLGLDSTVPYWRAEHLEASGYTEIMGAHINDVTNTLVSKAYGYNAISTYIGNTPNPTYDYSGQKAVDVPYGLQTGSTVYEYDDAGLLLGYFYHPVGSRYFCANSNCHQVEILTGAASDGLDEYYNIYSVGVGEHRSYRVYQCSVINGVPDNQFIDVTQDSTKHHLDNGRLNWLEPNPSYYPMVRTDAKFLAMDIEQSVRHGSLKFTLVSKQKRGATWSNWIMQVPTGKIDVFLNGRSLIRNLDYIVKFPEVWIINKAYLIDQENQPQQIHVRLTGFCSDALEFETQGDAGFIEHGYLSNNNRFDLRDDKVLRITVDGKLYNREQIEFSEEHSGVSVINTLNGKPYSVDDILVPFKGLSSLDTYALRQASQQIDQSVSDYLTLKIPQPPRPAPVAIAERYPIYSPFLNKLTHDLDSGILQLSPKVYSDRDVLLECKPYEYLLSVDPTQPETPIDDRYVIIHPHNLGSVITLTQEQYRFITAVVRLYCHGRVTLSPFIVLS